MPTPVTRASSSSVSQSKKKQQSSTSTSLQANVNGGETDPARQLLSTPQKRLNHIMSEQKRRNTIRDGYAQLIALLAPDGAPAIDMPTRGRPKGSGGAAKTGTKGKSGVLFRAVEYVKFLEENTDALRKEVERVERATGVVS